MTAKFLKNSDQNSNRKPADLALKLKVLLHFLTKENGAKLRKNFFLRFAVGKIAGSREFLEKFQSEKQLS